MGTVTKTFTENSGQSRATWTVALSWADITVTGNTVNFAYPSVTASYNGASGKNQAYAIVDFYASEPGFFGYWRGSGSHDDINYTSWANKSSYALNRSSAPSPMSCATSLIFTSSNKTTRVAYISPYSSAYYISLSSFGSSIGGGTYNNTGEITWTNAIKITLDVPPTFSETFSYTGDFSGVPYANLTTASVSLSSLSAKYGGDFSGVGNAEFIIGSQSVSKPNPANGDVLSIALNAVGTFNPIVKITDSRGQVTTHTLSAITVMSYNAPTVSFDASRTLSDGTPDDEGTYAFIEATFNFTDVIADAVAPSVVVTDDDGTVTTPVVDWYTDAGLTTPVTWSSLSSGDTVYGIFSGLSTQHSYTVSVRPRDSEGTGTAVTQTIGAAFYTVDFLAGGHGIAFGKPASNVGFECAMEATFEDDLLLDLPQYQTADTTDKAIYDAVVALGWDSDVLIN